MPVPVEVERLVYRDIPAEYLSTVDTQPRPADPVTYRSVLLSCAKDRATVETLNGRLAAIRAIQGAGP